MQVENEDIINGVRVLFNIQLNPLGKDHLSIELAKSRTPITVDWFAETRTWNT